jgi:hypothetical protein
VNGIIMERNESLTEEDQLIRLRELAKVGFDQLDRGEGTVIDDIRQLKTYIASLSQRGSTPDSRYQGSKSV